MDSDLGFISSSESVVLKLKQSQVVKLVKSGKQSKGMKFNVGDGDVDYGDMDVCGDRTQNSVNEFSKTSVSSLPTGQQLSQSHAQSHPQLHPHQQLFPDKYVRVFTPEDYYIAGITFGVKGPEEILSQSVCEITENTIYN